jgi:NAD(P)-dependent dehydrogenase (short-subunit alcohol dehydrogenase family)
LRLPISLPLNTQAQSATGIGRSAALLFAREGAKALYLSDLPRQEAGLKALEKLIGEKYPDVKVTLVPGDAADEASVKGICDRAIKEHGQLDVFFANAAMIGQSSYVSMENLAAADFDKMMHVNVVSCVSGVSFRRGSSTTGRCFLAIKYGAPAMRITSADKPYSHGSIVLTASVAGTKSGAGPADYSWGSMLPHR